ncbi:MAG: tyrosine-type recombinase/integrase [Prolixibacteraceae bacterium]
MRKKSGFTIVEQAVVLVPEFEKVVRRLEQQVTLRGQSKSTLNNYIRRIALFVVHFGKLPEQIDPEEINEYLAALALDPRSPSRSSFKHMVYGLRYYYRLLGMNKNAIALPSLKGNTKLPVILNHQELKELFAAPTLLKQRVVLTLIYSAGLRGQEVINLKISDIDFERRTIHIRQSKYKKDRIVPLADSMAVGLKKYLKAENPHIWLFNGKEPDGRYSVRGLSWVMRENLKKTSITKDVNLHSLRHAYATHLLEQGLNIVTLKELLGHAEITTTMIYLHVAQCPLIKPHSPLDTLYDFPKKKKKKNTGSSENANKV